MKLDAKPPMPQPSIHLGSGWLTQFWPNTHFGWPIGQGYPQLHVGDDFDLSHNSKSRTYTTRLQ